MRPCPSWIDGSFDCAMMSFGLHENEVDAVDAVIAEMKRVVRDGGLLILLDFNVPLRGPAGIFIRTIEFLIGKGNYRCFRSYIDGGGLEGVLSRNRLSVGKRDGTSNKALKVIRVNNS